MIANHCTGVRISQYPPNASNTGTLAQLVERMPYKHQVASSTLARPTILKALSQVGKAQDSESCTDGSNPSGPAIPSVFTVMIIDKKVAGDCNSAGRSR